MKALIHFIGNLFLKELIAAKVISQVMHDLVFSKKGPAKEHDIECVCELLLVTGTKLDSTRHGRTLMSQVSAHLNDWKRLTSEHAYSGSACLCLIQAVLDMRRSRWQRRYW